jgi:dienelactone hydrolase
MIPLTRREWIASVAAAAAIPNVPYRQYSRCLPDYLRGLAAEAYRTRNRAIARLTTPQAIQRRQGWVRETFWKLAGGRPQSTPLNVRTTGAFERDGYRVEKLVYESQPGFIVPANLYIPVGAGPFPGVLFQMGHSRNGKAYEPYQRCCQGLARLGFVVLAFDPVGQGERIFYPGADPAVTRLESPDSEHTMPGRQLLLCGDSMTRMQAWDAVRSLDVLAAHPLVDPKRLASTGQSGGGTLTMMLAAVDDRLAAAAVSAGNLENFACAGFDPPGSTDDAEQDFIGAGPMGFDRWDLLYPLAPKPLLVQVSARDFFGTYSPKFMESAKEEFGKLEAVYARLGQSAHLAWADTPLPHALAYDSRVRTYQWLSRWLRPGAPPVTDEPATAPETDQTLRATESGSVVVSLGSATPFSMNRRRAATAPSAEVTPKGLAALLSLETPPAGARFTTLGRARSGKVEIEAVEVRSAPEVWLPAWIFSPRDQPAKFTCLLLEPESRNTRWHEGEMYQTLAASNGLTVCVPNLRGIDDLAPEFGRGNPRYIRGHNNEENFSWASLMLGRPMLGQWVTDILCLSAALQRRNPGGRLMVAARGKLTPAALIAAALDPAPPQVLYLAGGLASLVSLATTEDYRHTFANFVPKCLPDYDLPGIARLMKRTGMVLGGVLDGQGKQVPEDEIHRLYPEARLGPGDAWEAPAIVYAALQFPRG